MGNNPLSLIDPDGGKAITPIWMVDALGFLTKVGDSKYWKNKDGDVFSTKYNEDDVQVDIFIGISKDNEMLFMYDADPLFAKSWKKNDIPPYRNAFHYLIESEYPMHTTRVQSHDAALDIIEFMHKVTIVEFAYAHYKFNGIDNFFMGTTHNEGNSTATPGELGKEYELIYKAHNHPGYDSFKPSGLKESTKEDGDIQNAQNHPKAIYQIYYGRTHDDKGYSTYKANGVYFRDERLSKVK